MKNFFLSRWIPRFQAVPEGPVWRALWVVSVGASFLGLSMEWVFFATKPSFMNVLTGWEQVRVLLLSPLLLVGISAGICLVLWWVASAMPRARAVWVRVGGLWPGFLLASLFLLLLDNFTYTVFHFGIQSTESYWRYGYLILFLVFWIAGWRISIGLLRVFLTAGCPLKRLFFGMGIWGAVCILLLASAKDRIRVPTGSGDVPHNQNRPNILLLASDGLSATHLSVYGSDRETTPFIREFAEGKALICENAFANAQNSGGSVASMLTGKLPTTLRLYYPPEILMGKNAYEHLPGILRQHGYQNLDISARQFVDAYDLNMRHAFQEANGRMESTNSWANRLKEELGTHTGYFLNQVEERIRDRLWHVMGLKDFVSAYEVVAGETLREDLHSDQDRIERLIRFITTPREQPFFVHVHLLGTHGPQFLVKNPVFSKGKEPEKAFDLDFYDDAILEFDGVFEEIIQALESSGQLENTVVVLNSDHSKGWGSERIPLIFWFPKGAHAGRIRANAQLLDMAPTLLDFLDIEAPDFLEGVSLLDGEPPERRPIFIAAVNSQLVNTKTWVLDLSRCPPPFYSLGYLIAVMGQQRFTLNVETGGLDSDVVSRHTQPLSKETKLSQEESMAILVGQLEKNGFTVPVEWKAGL